jgi:hypothetical protein
VVETQEHAMNDGLEPADQTAGARERVIGLTLRVLRRRRRTRQGIALAIVLGAFAAGFATSRLVPPSPPAAVEPGRASRPIELAPAPPTPGALESQAVAAASPDERASLLRAAGDRYLTDHNDVAAALRCYRAVLELTSSTDRARSDPGDSWLLAALKRGSD